MWYGILSPHLLVRVSRKCMFSVGWRDEASVRTLWRSARAWAGVMRMSPSADGSYVAASSSAALYTTGVGFSEVLDHTFALIKL
jgi:hypothetical protein